MEVLAVILDSFTRKESKNQVFVITRKSFLIRWLTVSSDNKSLEEKCVIDIEHIQTGKHCRLSSMEEASLWMRETEAESVAKPGKTASPE